MTKHSCFFRPALTGNVPCRFGHAGLGIGSTHFGGCGPAGRQARQLLRQSKHLYRRLPPIMAPAAAPTLTSLSVVVQPVRAATTVTVIVSFRIGFRFCGMRLFGTGCMAGLPNLDGYITASHPMAHTLPSDPISAHSDAMSRDFSCAASRRMARRWPAWMPCFPCVLQKLQRAGVAGIGARIDPVIC
jgi:hypothetical protein